MTPERFRGAWSMQIPAEEGRRRPTVQERIDVIVARVTRAAREADVDGSRSDVRIDALLLAALVTAGADVVRAKLE